MDDVSEGHNLYKYNPLPTEKFIRLLELHPGQVNDDIKCTLQATNVEDAPEYEALSYAWGDATTKSNVSCDGKIILVTQNLKDALVRLRLEEKSRLVWADAICINQSDMVEKGPQVKMMKQIYDNATRVCVWLGHASAQMQPAFELMDKIVGYSWARKETGESVDQSKKRHQY